MRKSLAVSIVLTLSILSSPAFSEDTGSIKTNILLRPRAISDFVTKKSSMDFDLSGIRVEKNINDNVSGVIFPGFVRTSNFVKNDYVENDFLSFALIEGYFNFNDITKGYGDANIGMKAGQFIVPFYNMEQKYQPYRFIYKPLDYKTLPTNFADLGLMLYSSFFSKMLDVSFGYITGAGVWNNELREDENNDNTNAGAFMFTTSFYPFKNGAEAVKELSLTFNWKAVLKAASRSNCNVLLGYKYRSLATSFEVLRAYSRIRSKDITATSLGISYDIYGPFQAIGRWDYTDNMGATPRLYHFFLLGMNTKWQDSKIQAALTYDQDYNPATKAATAKRLMLAAQFNY